MNIDTWRRLLDVMVRLDRTICINAMVRVMVRHVSELNIEPDHDGHWRVNVNADWYKHKTRDLKHRTTDQGRRERARIIGGGRLIY
jgi:hypothetical protein